MSDKLFKRIASEYMEKSGEELRRELDELARAETPQITPSLDRRVRGKLAMLRRARFIRTAGLVAACLTLALLLPTVMRQQQSDTPADMLPTSPSATTPSPELPTLPAYEIIPLSFTMPTQFSVAAVEQDIEKTVYYIEDAGLDNIVMTLEYADGIELYSGLTPIYIGGYTAYGCAEQGYRLLALEKQGILYVLTCEYDINTLVALGEGILDNV